MMFLKDFPWMKPVLAFAGTVLAGLLFRWIVLARLTRWSRKTRSQIDDILIETVHRYFPLMAALAGCFFAFETAVLSPKASHVLFKTLAVSFIVFLVLASSHFLDRLIRAYSTRIESKLPVTSLTQYLAKVTLYLIGLLFALNALGVSITPLLATLGVGGLAVALALQDTLSNVFAGFHIILSQQIRIGDFIRLESGEEGYVTDITWRTLAIRMLPNNIVLVPNSKAANSVIVNTSLPEKAMAVLVEVSVHYDSDLSRVESVVQEVAKDVMLKAQGGIPEFDPFIRYHTFGDSGIHFSVILRGREFVDQYLIKHEFIKTLHERFRREGIVIPYPMRTVQIETMKTSQSNGKAGDLDGQTE
jgi:small-conductance mechanosensitive channel